MDEVAADLRIGKRTLDGWLAADLLRAIDDRRFQFHTMRGRKRIWSATAFQNLEAAIERESAPGGVLAGSRSKSETVTGTQSVPYGSQAVQSASDKVLAWPLRPPARPKQKQRSIPTSRTSKRRSPAKLGEVIQLR
jgi:hypothetical protein